MTRQPPRLVRVTAVLSLLSALTVASAEAGLDRGVAGGPPLAWTGPTGAASPVTPVLLAPAGLEQLPGGAPAPPGSTPAAFSDAPPDGERVRVAIAFAMAQIGLPYVWGGNGPAAGHAGFDCSGLTTAAYAAAGIRLPRTAHTQYYAGPHVPPGMDLLPGDLVFYGVPSRVHHVGLYLGEGRMVAAPTFGKPVRVSFVRWRGDDYLGATRPAASPGSLRSGYLPAAPAPAPGAPAAVPPSSDVFAAPEAPPLAAAPPPAPEVVPLPPGPVTEGAVDILPATPPAPSGGVPTPTPGPTPTPTPTPSPTPTPTPTPTPSPTPTPTPSPSPTPTPALVPTPTPTPTPRPSSTP